MEAEVVSITKERSCRAQLANDILVVFQEVPGRELELGDRLRFIDLRLDAEVRVIRLADSSEFTAYIAANDVHDLRLPMKHGTSRTPSEERLYAP